MQLVKQNSKYIALSTYEEKDIPKSAGFRYDGAARAWWTADPAAAAKLSEYASDELKAEFASLNARRVEALEASRATDAVIDIPAPAGLSYLPYQRAGIAFAAQRSATLIADEMGLGKTIQSLGVINLNAGIKKVLVVCPASLRLNWKRELEKWLVRPLSIGIATAKELPETDVVIVNYDILNKLPALANIEFDLLVGDECHFAKNQKALRSKAFYKLQAKNKIFLTGTPITNRPSELFPIVNALDPATFPNFMQFARRYCNAHATRFGWDFSGAANLPELQEKLRASIMIRRLKKDVLTDLPAKRRQIIEFPANGAGKIIKNEQETVARHEAALKELRAAVKRAKTSTNSGEYERAVARLKDAVRVAFEEMSRLRRETAIAKIPYVIDHLRDLISEDSTYKVVLMAHHKQVVREIAAAFGDKAVVLTGDTSMEARQQTVDAFQNPDSGIQIFVGSIRAAGVGITLTASAHVVFAELDWTPAAISQAEDRVHRIGQQGSVLVQTLVLEGSLDAKFAKTIAKKLNVIEKTLDKTAAETAETDDEDIYDLFEDIDGEEEV